MALIAKALTTLADVKLLAGISASDTSKDSFLELLINRTSVFISKYCNRDFSRAERTEPYQAPGDQYLELKCWPIVSIGSITDNGSSLDADVDFYLSDEDKERGTVFKPDGWAQDIYTTGLTEDPSFVVRNLSVTYTAGYYLPADAEYVLGADESLPMDISVVCAQMALDDFLKNQQGGTGLKSLTEGKLSYTWERGADAKNNTAGLTDSYAGVLNYYKRLIVA